MEEWQVAIIEMRKDLKEHLRRENAFRERLIWVLLGVAFGTTALNSSGLI